MIGPKVAKPSKAEEKRTYALVNERDEHRCQKCHRGTGLSCDHRLNRSQGGRTLASNLQILCGSGTTGCHGEITGEPEMALIEGWRVPMGQDPSTWPARRWLRTDVGTMRPAFVLYDDDGGWTEIPADVALARMGVL